MLDIQEIDYSSVGAINDAKELYSSYELKPVHK